MIHDEVPQVPSAASHKAFFEEWKVAMHRSTAPEMQQHPSEIHKEEEREWKRRPFISFHKGGEGESRLRLSDKYKAKKALPRLWKS